MIQHINFSQFCDSFSGSYSNAFTYEGARALFDYLEEVEQDTGQEIELDPVALCCEFTEYEDLKAVQADYSDIKSLEQLEEHTTVVPVGRSKRLIIADY
jgi:hypothetical protein